MKTDTLIQSLAAKATPVKPLPHAKRRHFVWLTLSLLFVSFGAFLIGLRVDLSSSLRNPTFLLQIGATLLIVIAATGLAFSSSIPNAQTKRKSLIALLTIGFGFSIFLVPVFLGHSDQLGLGSKCLLNVVLLSLLPVIMISTMVYRSFPLQRKQTAYFAFLGAAAVGSFSTRLICPQDGALHFLVWHLLPVFGFAALGCAAGNWWDRHSQIPPTENQSADQFTFR